MNEFETNNQTLLKLIGEWESKLLSLNDDLLLNRRNSQNRSIKQILGHMIDSASNNTHRIIHLQYQPSPLIFPDYANFGNNDRWISIQNYQSENWVDLVQLWKYLNFHIVHVIRNVNLDQMNNEWISAKDDKVTLEAMVFDYLPHFQLHLNEIHELINQE